MVGKVTGGMTSTRSYLNVTCTLTRTHKMQSPSHGQRDAANLPQIDLSHSPLREYEITLSSGEVMYILAANSEEAAWDALELSMDRTCKLVNVRRTDEW